MYGIRLLYTTLAFFCLVSGCDTAEEPVTGSLTVQATFPDGTTPALVSIEVFQLVPTDAEGRWLREPFLGTNYAETSSITFNAVPADSYYVTTSSWNRETVSFPLDSDTEYADTILVGESGATAQTLVGITGATIDDPSDVLGISAAVVHYPHPRAYASAVRYDFESLRVGDRTDLVRWVRLGGPLYVQDYVARQAAVHVYRIPDAFVWDGSGGLTYEDLEALEPYASYTVGLNPLSGDGREPYEGCVLIELDPDFFFDAHNGIAIAIEGESVSSYNQADGIVIAYTWDGGNPHDRMPNCEGGYGWPGDGVTSP